MLSLSLTLSLLNGISRPVLAQEGEMGAQGGAVDSSLDSMWSDHPQTADKKAEEKKPVKASRTAKKVDKKKKSGKDSADAENASADLAPAPAAGDDAAAKASAATSPSAETKYDSQPIDIGETKEVKREKRSTALANPRESQSKDRLKDKQGKDSQTDQSEITEKTKDSDKTKSTEKAENTDKSEKAEKSEPNEGASAPLCEKADFLNSELVKSTAWPGVGPFTNDSAGEYSDPQENKLSIETKEDRVIAVELLLNNVKLDNQNFLNLEMTCDFMLEALGAKGKRIANFNKFLERNNDNILGTEKAKGKTKEAVYSTTNGPYLISLKSLPTEGSHAFLVQVKSKDASADLLKAHNLAAGIKPSQVEEPAVESQPEEVAVKPPVKAPVKSGKATVNATTAKTTTNQTSTTQTAATTNSGAGSNEALKKELGDVIVRWQQIKKAAVKNKDVSELPKILSGKALARQSDAVKWLESHKQHYEVELRSVTVDHYQLLSQSPKRYAVYANVKESSKVVLDDSNQVKSDTTDSYNVNYTIERVADHWSISDSLLLPKTGAKPQAKH